MKQEMTKEAMEAMREAETMDETVMNPPEVVEPEKPAQIDPKVLEKELKKRTAIIRKEMGRIESSFLTIAFQIYWVYDTDSFKLMGYKNIYDYAEDEFNIKKTTTHNFLCIVENFAERDENGKIIEKLIDKWKDFTVSKLTRCVALTDENRKIVTPQTTVKKLEEMIKQQKELEEKQEETEEKEEDKKDAKKKEEILTNTLIAFDNYKKYQQNLEEIDKLVEIAFKKSTYPIKIKIVMEQTV